MHFVIAVPGSPVCCHGHPVFNKVKSLLPIICFQTAALVKMVKSAYILA